MERNPITPQGFAALELRLKHEKEVVRPQIVIDIETARAHGDLSENSEYDDAKERQSHCESRINQLGHWVATAQIIELVDLPQDGIIRFGTTVKIKNDAGDCRTYKITGQAESDIANGLIGIAAPLARALIGKEEGDEVSVNAPSGKINWEIVGVSYES
jgi:transcription elongation factor GreA